MTSDKIVGIIVLMGIKPEFIHIIDDEESVRDMLTRRLARKMPPSTDINTYANANDFEKRVNAELLAKGSKHLFFCDFDLKDNRNAPALFDHLDSLLRSGDLNADNFSVLCASAAGSGRFNEIIESRKSEKAPFKDIWRAINFAEVEKPFDFDKILGLLNSWGFNMQVNSAPPPSSSSPSAKEAH